MRGIDRRRRRVYLLAPLGSALVNDPMHVAPDDLEPHPRVRGPIHVLACEEVLGLVIDMFVLVAELLCETVQVVDRRAHLEVLALVLARAALAQVSR